MSSAVLCQLATGFFSELKKFGGFPFASDRILFWCLVGGLAIVCVGVFRSAAVRALFHRELSAYFLSPIAYVVLTVFVLISSIIFHQMLINARTNEVSHIIGFMCILMVFISPVLTMRLFAEESRSGTIEVLMTAPITDAQVVLGKYFAAMFFYAFLFVPSLAYTLVLCWLGSPDDGTVFSSYFAAMLMGSVFVSVGILISSLTSNQIVAAVAGIIFLFLMYVAGSFVPTGTHWVQRTLRYLSLFGHLENLRMGVVDTRDLIFFVSMSAFFLFLTVRSVESRKWRL
ncbi:MAG: ABC transporter permease [Planctomycetes bacterium]|nr:ABC transporter permease [Planctomycetota bacterium]